ISRRIGLRKRGLDLGHLRFRQRRQRAILGGAAKLCELVSRIRLIHDRREVPAVWTANREAAGFYWSVTRNHPQGIRIQRKLETRFTARAIHKTAQRSPEYR